jgi:hypothetical protein
MRCDARHVPPVESVITRFPSSMMLRSSYAKTTSVLRSLRRSHAAIFSPWRGSKL